MPQSRAFPAKYNAVDGTDKVFIFNLTAYRAGRSAAIYARSVDSTPGWTSMGRLHHALLITPLFREPYLATGRYRYYFGFSGYRGDDEDSEATFNVWVRPTDVFITNKDEADTLLLGIIIATLWIFVPTLPRCHVYFNPETGAINISTPFLFAGNG
jgi:hypothetical protein